jgi:hypothetical protein
MPKKVICVDATGFASGLLIEGKTYEVDESEHFDGSQIRIRDDKGVLRGFAYSRFRDVSTLPSPPTDKTVSVAPTQPPIEEPVPPPFDFDAYNRGKMRSP